LPGQIAPYAHIVLLDLVWPVARSEVPQGDCAARAADRHRVLGRLRVGSGRAVGAGPDVGTRCARIRAGRRARAPRRSLLRRPRSSAPTRVRAGMFRLRLPAPRTPRVLLGRAGSASCCLSFAAASYSASAADSSNVAACDGPNLTALGLGTLSLLGAGAAFLSGKRETARATSLGNYVDIGQHGAAASLLLTSGSAAAALDDDWTAQVDPASGKTYYYSARTRETMWEKPAATVQHDHSESWTAQVDPASGKTYYYNPQTQETAWEKPPVAVAPIDAPAAAPSVAVGAAGVPLIGEALSDRWNGSGQFAVIDTYTKVLSFTAKAVAHAEETSPARTGPDGRVIRRARYKWRVDRTEDQKYGSERLRREYGGGQLAVRIDGKPYRLSTESSDSLMFAALKSEHGWASSDGEVPDHGEFLIGSEYVWDKSSRRMAHARTNH
jgi:uncharacterized protein (DUF2147 family)